MNVKICSICHRNYVGFGNNAEPVNSGRCCDDCNSTIVIPARLYTAGLYATPSEECEHGNIGDCPACMRDEQ
jgi:hypothetical protein